MGVREGVRACLVVVRRCEDKSAGVSLTPSFLGFPWSVLDPSIGEGFADPTLTTLHVLCHTCNVVSVAHSCLWLQSLMVFVSVYPSQLWTVFHKWPGEDITGSKVILWSVNRARHLPGV